MSTPQTRRVDPVTRDYVFDNARRKHAAALSPDIAIVQNVVMTTLGSALRDPTYGIERVDNAAPNAEVRQRIAIERGLKRWIDAGFLRNVVVTAWVVAAPTGHEMRARVEFVGRDGERRDTGEMTV